MREKVVSFGGKDIRIIEMRIGELEKLVTELFPESGGDIQKIDLTKFLENAGFELLYEKIPVIFPDISGEDVKNAYMSELEGIVEAFVDVNFTGIKRLMKPIMGLVRAGAQS